jgi:peroxiredoxin (alkyl hydroperoxide reductase subunit C)
MAVGRNFDEILRVIDALQIGDKHGIATPVEWQAGDKVIIPPTVSNADASQKFPQGFDEILPYLRYVDVSK